VTGEMPPLTTVASPEGWSWSLHDASRPRRAVEHIAHSETAPVGVDRLRPSDTPSEAAWTLAREVPILVVDTLDAYWAFERVLDKLHGFARTPQEAKSDLVRKLGGHLQLLTSLESPKLAPVLKLELEFLRAVLRPPRDEAR